MVAPLVVGRDKSIKALERAMEERTEIFLATQKDPNEDEPNQDGVYHLGTIAKVLQLLKLPDGTIKALVEGKRRGRVIRFIPNSEYLEAEILEPDEGELTQAESVAYMRETQDSFKEFAKVKKKIPQEVIASVSKIDSPSKFADVLASHLPVKTKEKQGILEAVKLQNRLETVLNLIYKEIEVASIEGRIRSRVKRKMDKTQKDYYLAEQVRALQQEMGQQDEWTAGEDPGGRASPVRDGSISMNKRGET